MIILYIIKINRDTSILVFNQQKQYQKGVSLMNIITTDVNTIKLLRGENE